MGDKLNRSLIAYSFLAQATRGEGDLLSGLTPIFKPIARRYAGKRFDCSEFSKVVEEIYGLKVHPWAVEDLASRLEKTGLLERVQQSSEIHEYVYAEIKEEFNDVSPEDIQDLIKRFVEFSGPILIQYAIPVNEEALEEGFLEQLIDMNFVSIMLKPDRTKEDNRHGNTLALKKPTEQVEWEQVTDAKSKIDVLCASFIMHVYQNEPSIYEMLMRIVSGALISEVILNLQDPGQTSSLKGLTVILDAPFLMSALDLASEEAHVFAKEICDQLRDKGATLAAFSHSIDELKDNLKAVKNRVQTGEGFGATARRLSDVRFSAYAAAVLEDPERRLKQDAIRVITPPTTDASYAHFTGEDQENVRRSFGYFFNQIAQERDAQSVAATIRLRNGVRVKMGRFSSSRYIFVTENPRIAEKTKEYLERHHLFSDGEVPPAISERYLAGLLWVIYGGKGKDLPRHLLLANCAAALEPRSDVVKQMHRFLADIDDDQAEFFHMLMTEERAGQYAMQLTLGDSALLNKDNAMMVLEQVKASLAEKLEAKKNREIAEIRAQHDEEIAKQKEVSESLRTDLLKSKGEQLGIQEELAKSNQKVDGLTELVLAEKRARLEEQRKQIERCVRSTLKHEKATHIGIGLFIASILSLIAWYGPDEHKMITKILTAIVAWLITFFFIWKVPDHLFANYFTKKRNDIFLRNLAAAGLEFDALIYDVDWHGGVVSIIPEPEAPISK